MLMDGIHIMNNDMSTLSYQIKWLITESYIMQQSNLFSLEKLQIYLMISILLFHQHYLTHTTNLLKDEAYPRVL